MYYNSPILLKPSKETLIRNLCHQLQYYVDEDKNSSKKRDVIKKKVVRDEKISRPQTAPSRTKTSGGRKCRPKPKQVDYQKLLKEHEFPHLRGKRKNRKIVGSSLLSREIPMCNPRYRPPRKIVDAKQCNQRIIHAQLLERIHPGNHAYSTESRALRKKGDQNVRVKRAQGDSNKRDAYPRLSVEERKELLTAKQRALLRLEGYSKGLKDGIESKIDVRHRGKCVKDINTIIRAERNFIRRDMIVAPKYDKDKLSRPNFDSIKRPMLLKENSQGTGNQPCSNDSSEIDLKAKFNKMYLEPPEDGEETGNNEVGVEVDIVVEGDDKAKLMPERSLLKRNSSLLEEIQYEVLSESMPTSELHREFKQVFDESDGNKEGLEREDSAQILLEKLIESDSIEAGNHCTQSSPSESRPSLKSQRSLLEEVQYDVLSESFGEAKAKEMLSTYRTEEITDDEAIDDTDLK